MKCSLLFAALCLVACALGDDAGEVETPKPEEVVLVPVPDPEAAENDEVFVKNVEHNDKEEKKGGEADGKGRQRRSIPVDLDLLSPGGPLSYSQYAVDSALPFAADYNGFHARPSVQLRRQDGFGDSSFGFHSGSARGNSRSGLLRSPANSASAYGTQGYFVDSNGDGAQWSFVKFYNSFHPMQAVKTADNTFVRNYFRYGTFTDVLSDFWRLQPKDVRSLSGSNFVADYDYRLLAGVSAGPTSYFPSVQRETTVGYVGVMSDYPYRVVALKSGCELDGFPGFHDCIVFSGATYPYASTVRRFVYVREQYAAYAPASAYGPATAYSGSAVYGVASDYNGPAAAYGSAVYRSANDFNPAGFGSVAAFRPAAAYGSAVYGVASDYKPVAAYGSAVYGVASDYKPVGAYGSAVYGVASDYKPVGAYGSAVYGVASAYKPVAAYGSAVFGSASAYKPVGAYTPIQAYYHQAGYGNVRVPVNDAPLTLNLP